MWHTIMNLRCAVLCQISHWSVHPVADPGQETQIWPNLRFLGTPISTPLHRQGEILQAMACTSISNFTFIEALCHHWRAKKRIWHYFQIPHSVLAPSAGVPQTRQSISAASGPKFTIFWGHVEEILLLNKFFRLSIRALVAKIQPDKVVRWCPDGDFLRHFGVLYFSASRVQHISDMHSKFALRPHHMWKYGRHPICGGWH